MRGSKAGRESAYEKMCETFRPYLGRCVAQWSDKQKDSVYIWLVCSRKEDAGEGRHQWRGTVAVRIMSDGSTFVFMSEDLVAKFIDKPIPDTWTKTDAVLDALIPDLQGEAA